MQSAQNDFFEETLKDILSPEDRRCGSPPAAKGPRPASGAHQDRRAPLAADNTPHVPRWVETVVRIVAGIVIFVLLCLFGLQVASR